MANAVPDSLTPRRLIAISRTTSPDATQALCPSMASIAEAAFCTPDEIDTATVST